MIITTFNIRGLGGGPKKCALRRLFSTVRPDLILIQETMAPAWRACHYFLNIFPGWEVSAVDSVGHSGGLLCIWNPSICNFASFSSVAGILLVGKVKGLEDTLKVYNIYGPFRDREPFWQDLIEEDHIRGYCTILGGDMNFTVSPSEVWGSNRWDPLAGFFRDFMEEMGLIDICPVPMSPSWRNNRVDSDGVAKRLDRFLLTEQLVGKVDKYRVWHEHSIISDHVPVCLQLDVESHDSHYPFKFNHMWLEDPEFVEMVKHFWATVDYGEGRFFMDRFMGKLRKLKKVVKNWDRLQKKARSESLCHIEAAIDLIFENCEMGFFSAPERELLSSLEAEKMRILRREEADWRLKSRAIWIKNGDENTRFFHKFANQRRIQNAIWEIKGTDGHFVHKQLDIAEVAVNHFRDIFTDPKETRIADQLRTIQLYPRVFNDEDCRSLGRPVTLQEIEKILKVCAKEKSPGPDGWTVEFYLGFWDILGPEILRLTEEIRSGGYISGALNSTFIALIPKASKPQTFDEYRPISLCNFLYKINSKIIAERIKPYLARFITKEQFGFIPNRQIHDAVGLAQEGIHTIKVKKIKACLLRLDLIKAYDKVDWGFLRLLLVHIGMDYLMVNWIMACVQNVRFAVLINGVPSNFFHCHRGLRQGCPMSPLLFILVMDGLSRLICSAKQNGFLRGIQVSPKRSMTHVLFVDDVLLFGVASEEEWKNYFEIVTTYSSASGMKISTTKSILIHSERDLGSEITEIFSIATAPLDNGFKYLGFNLKPNAYRIGDWVWMWKKIENRISHWINRYLSLGGRLTLAKAVLESIPVYWLTLYKVPVSILTGIRKRIFSFIWKGGHKNKKMHLASWEILSKPKKKGGWGLKNLSIFSQALRMKSLWRSLNANTFWSQVIRDKYLGQCSVMEWFRKEQRASSHSSIIWRGFVEVSNWVKQKIAWHVGDGNSVIVGTDAVVGGIDSSVLSSPLVKLLQDRGYTKLHHFYVHSLTGLGHWLSPEYLRLEGQQAVEWRNYTHYLSRMGITLNDKDDILVWTYNVANGMVTAKLAYDLIFSESPYHSEDWWARTLWKWKVPLKLKCFFWLALHNRLLTWDNLCQRGWQGPGLCALCYGDSESVFHLFIHCPFSLRIWDYVIAELTLDWHWNHDNLEIFGEYFHRWSQTFRKHKSLFIFICWGIWRCRNDRIFNGIQASFEQVGSGIIGLYLDWGVEEGARSRRRIIEPLIIDSYPVGFFDGAAQMNCGGCGFLLLVSENHSFKGRLAVEESTNNFSELVAAWALLFWARHIFIRELRLFGDSRVVIDWLNNQATIHSINLQHWCNKIKGLLEEFSDFQCCHIYRELNQEADYLSKRGLLGTPGVLHVEEWRDGSRITGHILTLF